MPDPVLHRRVLLLNKSTRRFVIEDIVQGRDHHRLEWFFHLAPGCEVVLDADGRMARCRIDEVWFVIAPTALPEDAVAHIESGEYSPGYGRVLAAPVLRYEWSGRLPVTTRIVVALERDLADGALRAQEKSR